MHASRPGICRAYRCAWLGGAFEDGDRPDRLGAVLDLVPRTPEIHLVVRQATVDALDRSSRLREIVATARKSMPVEIRDVEDVLDADRAYRVLYPGGDEHRIEGEHVQVHRSGKLVDERRAPWLERQVRKIVQRWRSARLARWPTHEDRLSQLGLAGDKLPVRRIADRMNVTAKKFGYPSSLLAEYDHWLVLLRPAQVTLGSLVLVCKENASRFGEIGPAASAELHRVTARIETVIGEAFQNDKINYLMLMMVDPDVHFHVLPRYESERTYQGTSFPDTAWPGPPQITAALDVPESVLEALRADLAARFEAD